MPIKFMANVSLVSIDNWLFFRTTYGELDLIRNFRDALNKCLNRKFIKPHDKKNNMVLN